MHKEVILEKTTVEQDKAGARKRRRARKEGVNTFQKIMREKRGLTDTKVRKYGNGMLLLDEEPNPSVRISAQFPPTLLTTRYTPLLAYVSPASVCPVVLRSRISCGSFQS